MKLSSIIKSYRRRMNISQREFARRCDLSNSYISFLENELNPKTGKPIVPTFEQFEKIAAGLETTPQHLFDVMDADSPIRLRFSSPDPDPDPEPEEDPRIRAVADLMEEMTSAQKDQVLAIVRALRSTPS